MKKYVVTVEETISDSFEIIAKNDEEARTLIQDKYNKGEIILEPGNLTFKQMQINNITDNYVTEWEKF